MEEGGTYYRNKACQISYETEMWYWEELNQQNGKESISVRVRHAETSGNLQKWVDGLYFYNKSANQIRLYGDMAYIFHNQKLITVIKVPENLVPDIVAIRRFKEEKGRRKHESDRRTQKIG